MHIRCSTSRLIPTVALVLALFPAGLRAADAQAAEAKPVSPETVVVSDRGEEVIKAALRYLAAQQTPNGSWLAAQHSSRGRRPVAMTGYALMAYMSAGNLPNEGEYGKNVDAAVQFILNCVRRDGFITSENAFAGRERSDMYDHGIATIALAEIYGQTQSPKLREKLASAISLIVRTQNGQGGWRYQPAPADADISVTVLQVVALRAAKNAGLDVPQTTIDRAVEYVKRCNVKGTGGFAYQPGQGAGEARTAAAIYSLQVCGLYDDPLVHAGADFLLKHNPKGFGWFTYGTFYAGPAFYMIGGPDWKNWYSQVSARLLETVKMQKDQSAAYWDPLDGETNDVGPVYATCVYTMILAMPYHYIPLYQR